jgi:NhaP-type Na+/H+ or K+/H+ antiporter
VGGIFFGLLFGFIALFFLKRINYNGVLVVTIMIIFCYSIYMLMEFTVIKVSGIIALVTYGIFMGAFGKAHLVG